MTQMHMEEGQARGRGGKKKEKTPASGAYETVKGGERDGN